MCKNGGWQNSQASEVKKNIINTIKTSNKLNLSLPRDELQIQKVPFKACLTQQTPSSNFLTGWDGDGGQSRPANYWRAGSLRSALWRVVPARNLHSTKRNRTRQNENREVHVNTAKHKIKTQNSDFFSSP